MHLAVLGGIGHFYAMQVSLTCTRASENATYKLTLCFHQDIKLWRSLWVELTTRKKQVNSVVET